MARLIADGEVRIQFVPGEAGIVDLAAPTAAEITAGTDITPELGSIDTPLDGESVPAPDLSSSYRKTVAGGVSGEISATMYRDDAIDAAWILFPRNTTGNVVIRRFGGSDVAIAAADDVEVWPVRIISRSPASMGDTAVQAFTVTMAGLQEPELDATVAI